MEDLPIILNGRPADPIEQRPFDFTFKREKVLSAWHQVGFAPVFSKVSLQDPKVRGELGQEGDRRNNQLESLAERQAETRDRLREEGLNDFVFTASIPVARRIGRKVSEDEQKEELKRAGAFSANGVFITVGTNVINSKVVLDAQSEEVAKRAEEKLKTERKRADKRWEKIAAGKELLQSLGADNLDLSKVKSSDLKVLLEAVLKLENSKESISKFLSNKKKITKLESIDAWKSRLSAAARMDNTTASVGNVESI